MREGQHPNAALKPKTDERDAFEDVAKKMLSGEKQWKPTWQALGLNYERPFKGTGKGGLGSL